MSSVDPVSVFKGELPTFDCLLIASGGGYVEGAPWDECSASDMDGYPRRTCGEI